MKRFLIILITIIMILNYCILTACNNEESISTIDDFKQIVSKIENNLIEYAKTHSELQDILEYNNYERRYNKVCYKGIYPYNAYFIDRYEINSINLDDKAICLITNIKTLTNDSIFVEYVALKINDYTHKEELYYSDRIINLNTDIGYSLSHDQNQIDFNIVKYNIFFSYQTSLHIDYHIDNYDKDSTYKNIVSTNTQTTDLIVLSGYIIDPEVLFNE